jgi:hypothetical protein
MLQISEEAWLRKRDREREGWVHPCDSHIPDFCMCQGACSCHFTEIPEDSETVGEEYLTNPEF